MWFHKYKLTDQNKFGDIFCSYLFFVHFDERKVVMYLYVLTTECGYQNQQWFLQEILNNVIIPQSYMNYPRT